MQMNFSTAFEAMLNQAYQLGVANKNPNVEPIHLLIAAFENTWFKNQLKKNGCNAADLLVSAKKRSAKLSIQKENTGKIEWSEQVRTLLNRCHVLAASSPENEVTINLLLGVWLENKDEIGAMLVSHGANPDTYKNDKVINDTVTHVDSDNDTLQKYTIDLTRVAEDGDLDPVIGRDEEIRRAILVLQRRSKNNPVLIGDPGVGKTAIVEGLALRIVAGEVPQALKNNKILMLDLAGMLAGTKYRGEFEERFKAVINSLEQLQGEVVLFIDEIHMLVGAGTGGGEGLDASNMLKPALARGRLKCIGATTLDEYRKYIEKDMALERRFQKILVEEPDESKSIAILRGVRDKFELHHNVRINDDALISAVRLSTRYISGRKLPDKAIDLIDEAASMVRVSIDSNPEKIDNLLRHIKQLKMERATVVRDVDATEKLRRLDEKINAFEKENQKYQELLDKDKLSLNQYRDIMVELTQAKEQVKVAERNTQYEEMSKLRYEVIPAITRRLNEAKPKLHLLSDAVTENEIAEILTRSTGIPLTNLLDENQDRLLEMEHELMQTVIGQDKAISAVSRAIRRSRSGLAPSHRPVGSFLFLGSTGVGKTQLCKSLAQLLFNTEKSMVRLDMSEFMESHSVARLIGSPPGYVGYEEGGYLTESIRRKPYSVVLFDEIEKAHPEILNILLQVLDDGRLTDGMGRTVDFRNCVVIMTSNMGSGAIDHGSLSVAHFLKAAKEYFKPEFLNRIDEVVVFNQMNSEHMKSIIDVMLADIQKRLSVYEITIQCTQGVIDSILEKLQSYDLGARPLKRLLQVEIEDRLADGLLLKQIVTGDIVSVELDSQKEVCIKPKKKIDPVDKAAEAPKHQVSVPVDKAAEASKHQVSVPVDKAAEAPKHQVSVPVNKSPVASKPQGNAPVDKSPVASKNQGNAPVDKTAVAPKNQGNAPVNKPPVDSKSQANVSVDKSAEAPKSQGNAPVDKSAEAPKSQGNAPVDKAAEAPKHQVSVPVNKSPVAPKNQVNDPVEKSPVAPKYQVNVPVGKSSTSVDKPVDVPVSE